MQPTVTAADWLRLAAEMWSEAEATQDQQARRVKVILAEGYERLAKHAAFLAHGDAYPPVGWFSEKDASWTRFVCFSALAFSICERMWCGAETAVS